MLWARSACATALALALGLPTTVAAAPASRPAEAIPPSETPSDAPTGLVLGPATAANYEIRDADGGLVATVAVRPDEVTSIATPPGSYTIVDERGGEIGEVRVEQGERRGLGLPGQRAAPVAQPKPANRAAPLGPFPTPGPTPVVKPTRGSKSAKRWGAPLASAFVPGLGQAINRQPGKAVALFVATVGGTLAAVGLWRLRNRNEGTTASEPGASRSGEAARLGAFTLLTSGVGMLYLGQIFDAHAVARGRPVEPREDHVVALEVARFSSVGLSPGEPAYALYDDFNLSLMGQVFPRLSVGVSDLGFKLGPDQFVMQGGLRIMGRVYDGSVAARRGRGPKRLWLSLGGGALLQGITRDQRVRGLGIGDETVRRSDRSVGSALYGQVEGRYFFLDRWSLGLAPRISLPLTRRAYPRGRQLPRLATTFELGAFVGVHL